MSETHLIIFPCSFSKITMANENYESVTSKGYQSILPTVTK